MYNREKILSSDRCGCFYCGEMFPPTEVEDWTDERGGVGQTALCPKCGIDAVIGSKSGYPITVEFLQLMKAYWFQIAQDKNNHTKQTKETRKIKQTK